MNVASATSILPTAAPAPSAGVEFTDEDRSALSELGNLQDKTRDFEGLLLSQVMRIARAGQKETVLSGGFGEQIFQGMLDDEWTSSLASQDSGMGLGKALFSELSQPLRHRTATLAGMTDGALDAAIRSARAQAAYKA